MWKNYIVYDIAKKDDIVYDVVRHIARTIGKNGVFDLRYRTFLPSSYVFTYDIVRFTYDIVRHIVYDIVRAIGKNGVTSYTMSVFFNDVVRQVTMSYTM
jgi:hypothetical protein